MAPLAINAIKCHIGAVTTPSPLVMAGLVPAIHVFEPARLF
jgi:hypothetical protein